MCMYSLESFTYEKMLTRFTLPIRDIALSLDGQWAAVASEYGCGLEKKILNTNTSQ